MTDIVEQLRDLQSGAQWVCGETAATLEDAADEIQRLRAALMCCVQYDNKCHQTGRSCRDDAPCGCQLEAETWRMVAKDPSHE